MIFRTRRAIERTFDKIDITTTSAHRQPPVCHTFETSVGAWALRRESVYPRWDSISPPRPQFPTSRRVHLPQEGVGRKHRPARPSYIGLLPLVFENESGVPFGQGDGDQDLARGSGTHDSLVSARDAKLQGTNLEITVRHFHRAFSSRRPEIEGCLLRRCVEGESPLKKAFLSLSRVSSK